MVFVFIVFLLKALFVYGSAAIFKIAGSGPLAGPTLLPKILIFSQILKTVRRRRRMNRYHSMEETS
jgi:hypothetical protein